MTWSILQGDCVQQMRTLDDCSVDAVVCDPPYRIGFMGHEWDQPGVHQPVYGDGDGVEAQGGRKRVSQPNTTVSFGGAPHPAMEVGRYDLSLTANRRYQGWCETWAREVLRILKPGGHLLASCGTRTVHRMTSGIEDAGFEIRDTVLWLYGSGFPKSLDVSKAIDKAAGAEREVVVGRYASPEGTSGASDGSGVERMAGKGIGGLNDITAPATPEAEQWQGWGTALKPAHEPIVVARKPLIGTVAANVLEHGTGALNIDGCRIGVGEGGDRVGEDSAERRYADAGLTSFAPTPGPRGGDAAGRWPANVVLSEEAAEELDAQTGELHGHGSARHGGSDKGIFDWGTADRVQTGGDSGGASRFFYCAKTSRGERNAGLDPELFPDGNNHPTVKPINLMRWLVRLVTPPGGLVLDPFTGSGSTGCAAVLEGFDFIGCEREAEYVAIAEARIAFWAQHEGREVEDVLGLVAVGERERRRHDGAGQIGLEIG